MFKIEAVSNLGNVSAKFLIEERTEEETINRFATYAYPPTYCNECKNSMANAFIWVSNKDKEGNIYNSIKCCKCGAKAKMGKYKVGGFFWHKFEIYKKEQSQSNDHVED